MGWPWDWQGKESVKSTEATTQTAASEPQPKTVKQPTEKVQVGPSDVVVVGCGVITLGAVAGAVTTYHRGSKSLLADGINPSNRARMIPVAFQTLMLSTIFTGILGVMGFHALKAAGLFSADVAELPSAREAGRMLRNPRAYWREMIASEQGAEQASVKQAEASE